MELNAEYSPDGSRIAFASNQSGAYEIWRSNRDGSKPVRLTSMSSRWCANIRWSPDGGRIVFNAFTAVGAGPQNIWAVDSEGGAAQPLIGGGSSEDSYPNFSRDGKWIYFTSNRGGRFDVWKVSTGGGDPVQVTTARGANGIESVDGEWLFYIKDHFPEWETSLWRIPVQGGQEERVLESVMRHYVVVEEGIYFFSQTHPSLGRRNYTRSCSFTGSQRVKSRSSRKSKAAGRIRAFPFHQTADRFCFQIRLAKGAIW